MMVRSLGRAVGEIAPSVPLARSNGSDRRRHPRLTIPRPRFPTPSRND